MYTFRDVATGRDDKHANVQQYLLVNIGENDYGIVSAVVERIYEIKDWPQSTNTIELVKRIAQLCGVIMPAVDMRALLAGRRTDTWQFAAVIVMSLQGGRVGMVVDNACELIDVEEDHIIRVPPSARTLHLENVIGSTLNWGRRITLLDVQRLFAKRDERLSSPMTPCAHRKRHPCSPFARAR